jgi:hypothetical protein
MLESAGTSRVAGSRKVKLPERLLDDSKLPVVEQRVTANFDEVATDQRQVMVADAAEVTECVRGGGIADVAAQRIARIGGIGDDPPAAHDGGCLSNQPCLGIERMDREVLGHGYGWGCIAGLL